jgi:molecular chaperone DnaK
MADNMAYNAEKTMREQGDKIPADLRSEVEGKIAGVRSALKGSDTQQVRRALDELQASLQKVGAAVYGQAGAGAGRPPGDVPPEEPPPDGTVEGEFREV